MDLLFIHFDKHRNTIFYFTEGITFWFCTVHCDTIMWCTPSECTFKLKFWFSSFLSSTCFEHMMFISRKTILYTVSSLMGVSPASDFCMPTFRNHLSVPSSKAGIHPKDYSQYTKHGESLKSSILYMHIFQPARLFA
jgi:hypothetical protein